MRTLNVKVSDEAYLTMTELKLAMQREADTHGLDGKILQADAVDLALSSLNLDACLAAFREHALTREPASTT